MMRGLLVVVVALGLGAAGCATDVDDPIPVAPGPKAPVDHPQQSLSIDPPGNVLDNVPGLAKLGGPSPLPAINRETLPKFPVPKQVEP